MSCPPNLDLWFCDTEFQDAGAADYAVHCVVFQNFRTGEVVGVWEPQGNPCPINFTDNTVLVSYYAIAEVRAFLSLAWPVPSRVLDLFAEFRVETNGMLLPSGRSLIGALVHFGLPHMASGEKGEMRDIAIRGGPFSDKEHTDLLAYCMSDVQALAALYDAMAAKIDWPRALIRGTYMVALSRVEWRGIPINVDALNLALERWDSVKTEMIQAVDVDYGVFVGGSFSQERFLQYLAQHRIAWPVTETGRPRLDDDTFREMARMHPQLGLLRELRYALSKTRLLADLAIGPDGRNRCGLSPFASVTGRNQPSSAKFIFGPSVWTRNFIRPEPGRAIAYVDYSQQEFGIGAALSGDANMMLSYSSGDPYLSFAQMAGAVPTTATKRSHAVERERFKVAALAVQYGMQSVSLGLKMGESPAHGRELLDLHRRTYPDYWLYLERVVSRIKFSYRHTLSMGWRINVLPQLEGIRSDNTLGNFWVQGNGAEMLRLAIILADKMGVEVVAPVHDALLVEADEADIDEAVRTTQQAMRLASEIILNAPDTPPEAIFRLRSDAKIVHHPDHYSDPRGDEFWGKLREFVPQLPP